MDNFEVPQKIKRHVLKAINNLMEEQNKRYISPEDIIYRVKYQMRNLTPVKNPDDVIGKAIYNYCNLGILIKRNRKYAIRRVLDELRGKDMSSSVISKHIEISDHGHGTEEKANCSNHIQLRHGTNDNRSHTLHSKQSTTDLAQHPSVITLAVGSSSQPQSNTQTTQQIASSCNLPCSSNTLLQNRKPKRFSITIDGKTYEPPFDFSKEVPLGFHAIFSRRKCGTHTFVSRGRDNDGKPFKKTITIHDDPENPEDDMENDCKTTDANEQNTDAKIDPKDDNESQSLK